LAGFSAVAPVVGASEGRTRTFSPRPKAAAYKASAVAGSGTSRVTDSMEAISAELVDADQVARGIAEGAVANAVGLLGRLLDGLGAAGLQPIEDAVEVVGGQGDGGVAALGDQLEDGAASGSVCRRKA